MRDLIRKIFKKSKNTSDPAKTLEVKSINQTTNAVFEKYKKSFKDLARYDREEKIL